MKILHLSASLSRKAGGIFEIELALARNLAHMGMDVSAFGLHDHEWDRDQLRWKGINTRVFNISGPRAFGYAPGMLKEMLGQGADVTHLHYMWMYPSLAVSRWSSETGRPYIVTPNGMLEPWALANSMLKKKLAGIFYEQKMLRRAACLQANTEKESRDIRAYGLKNPIAIIPNGVDLPEIGDRRAENGNQRKILLFLGRLHPKKGLINALKAWRKLRDQGSGDSGQEEWTFAIAGWDQGGHEAELKLLCRELGLAYTETPAAEFLDLAPDSRPLAPVLFLGPAFGETKDALLRSVSAFILPSFSEGLPMSVLEAWAYQLPVLMTDHCNLPDGFAADAAIRIGTDTDSIAEGMRLLHRSPASNLRYLGINGRALVEQSFTWPQVAAQMKEVYAWVLGDGPRPDCVQD